jgi:hypothetical protein
VAAFLQNNPYFQADPTKAACAIIDPTKIDPVAQAYVKNNLIPTTSTGTIVPNGPASDNRNEYNGKIDWNPTLKDRFTLTLATFKNPVNYPFLTTTSLGSAPNVPGYPGLNTFTSYFGSIAYSRTFSQTLLNEFRMTAQTIDNKLNFPQRSLPGPNALGINITPDQVTGPTQMLFANSGLQIGFNINGPANYADTTYSYVDTLSWTKGRNTFKMGGTIGVVQNNAYFDFAVDGQFGFYGSGSGSIWRTFCSVCQHITSSSLAAPAPFAAINTPLSSRTKGKLFLAWYSLSAFATNTAAQNPTRRNGSTCFCQACNPSSIRSHRRVCSSPAIRELQAA